MYLYYLLRLGMVRLIVVVVTVIIIIVVVVFIELFFPVRRGSSERVFLVLRILGEAIVQVATHIDNKVSYQDRQCVFK